MCCDSLIGEILNIKGKSKDAKKSCLDIVAMGIQQQLPLEELGKRIYLSLTCHTLSKNKLN